ncbi:hypothetical protein V5O48_002688 [Marasmius crinis-equi]|uniref:Uncharacterized protein n=1 Tax=Marasmius crinis-equi TaxID=585013 RepID=A0ABR3FUV4_9AGAR
MLGLTACYMMWMVTYLAQLHPLIVETRSDDSRALEHLHMNIFDNAVDPLVTSYFGMGVNMSENSTLQKLRMSKHQRVAATNATTPLSTSGNGLSGGLTKKEKKYSDTFLPVQAPPSRLSSPSPSPRPSRPVTPNTLRKAPPAPPRPNSPPPDWPSHMHNKCSRSKCTWANPPQCASGTYTCAGCNKGTYLITPAMAESALVLKQKRFKFEAENRRRMQEKEKEGEKVKEARDLKRYAAEKDMRMMEQEHRQAATRLMEEKKMMILRKQESERKKREEEERRNMERSMRMYETHFAMYEPSLTSSVDTVGERKRKVSLSEFPMPPTLQGQGQYLYTRHLDQESLNHKTSSSSFRSLESHRRRCASGTDRDRLRTKASTNTFRSARTRPPPKQEIPEEYYPYPESFRTRG